MVRTREIALTALIALGLAACGGGATVVPPDDDPEALSSVSAAVVGYPGTSAVAIEGRSQPTGDLAAIGVLYGFAARLDLQLLDPIDIPGSALVPAPFPGCDVTVTPASLRIAEFFAVANADASLILQLRNRPFDGELVGTEYVGFWIANEAGTIVATCDFGVQQATYDLEFEPGWNVTRGRVTAYDEGVLETVELTSIEAVPAWASWYVAP